MAEYIEREKTCGECVHADICKQVNGSWFSPHNIAYCKGFKNASDVVEVETLKEWLYQIAMNNVGVPIADMASACEEIVNRLDGLRAFAMED